MHVHSVKVEHYDAQRKSQQRCCTVIRCLCSVIVLATQQHGLMSLMDSNIRVSVTLTWNKLN